jgi:hypothetical protein
MADIFNLTDTWNNGATVFSAIKMNVTDTASDAASRLLDLRVGGNDRFIVIKDGRVTVTPTLAATPAINIDPQVNTTPSLIACRLAGVNHLTFGGTGSAADDFVVSRFNDSGVFQAQSFLISRSTGACLWNENVASGYNTGAGAGGTVTQITSRTTAVTLDKVTGEITLVSAAGSATFATFTVNNSKVTANSRIILNQKSGTDKYRLHVTRVAAGVFDITFATTGGTTTEQPVFSYMVLSGAAS